VGVTAQTLPGDVAQGRGDKIILPRTKYGTVKNVQNSTRFFTTFDFDREYLRNW